MKKLSVLFVCALAVFVVVSCGDDVRREPGRTYMPDMGYSRAYETYTDHSNLTNDGINYTATPVPGTVARDIELPYHLGNDSAGLAMANSVVSPIKQFSASDSVESERLYLINCAICHGTALNGNGPLYKDGAGPYAAKPATLVGDPAIEAKGEGDYFHVQTYGKGQMGSYASQLSRRQRWMIARYIKNKQKQQNGGAAPAAAAAADSSAAGGTTAK